MYIGTSCNCNARNDAVMLKRFNIAPDNCINNLDANNPIDVSTVEARIDIGMVDRVVL